MHDINESLKSVEPNIELTVIEMVEQKIHKNLFLCFNDDV